MDEPKPYASAERDPMSITRDGKTYKIRGRSVRKKPSTAAIVKKKLEYAEKTKKAMQLRATGMSYAQIAKAVGYSNGTSCQRAIADALDTLMLEPTEQLVKITLMTLDQMQAVLWNDFMKSGENVDLRIRLSDAILRIIDRRKVWTNVQDVLDGFSPTAQVNAQVQIHNTGGVLIIEGDAPKYMKQLEEAAGHEAPKLEFKDMLNGTIEGEIVTDDDEEEGTPSQE
jgi:hypothetical protein